MNWHVGAMPERPNLDSVVFAEDRSRQTHPSLREVGLVYQWYANVITPPARLSVMMKWRHIHQLAAGRWKQAEPKRAWRFEMGGSSENALCSNPGTLPFVRN